MANEQNLKPFLPGKDPRRSPGKPPGIPNSKTRLLRLLQLTQNLENPITGETEGFTVAEQLDMQQILKAQKGDIASYKEIMDRLEGRSKESIETSGEQKLIIETRKYSGDKILNDDKDDQSTTSL